MELITFAARPVQVQAIQWDGTPAGARAIADAKLPGVTVETISRTRGLIVCTPRKSWLCVAPQGWIVIGKSGEIWVETDEDFARRYEPA